MPNITEEAIVVHKNATGKAQKMHILLLLKNPDKNYGGRSDLSSASGFWPLGGN